MYDMYSAKVSPMLFEWEDYWEIEFANLFCDLFTYEKTSRIKNEVHQKQKSSTFIMTFNKSCSENTKKGY